MHAVRASAYALIPLTGLRSYIGIRFLHAIPNSCKVIMTGTPPITPRTVINIVIRIIISTQTTTFVT